MIAEEITFGEHEQEEFGLLPKQVIINPPEVKTYLVPVPGRSGSLDFTEALTDGQPAYSDRLLTITMYCFAEEERLPEMESACRNANSSQDIEYHACLRPRVLLPGPSFCGLGV
jgi:hypothetical protein